MSRSALIIDAPDSPVLRAARSSHASDAAAGVPPHLTVLYPFIPAEGLDERILSTLSVLFRQTPQFHYVLRTCGWFGNEVLWLELADPRPFELLTTEVTRVFPDYPPYGGKYDSFTPHATVANRGSFEELRALEVVVTRELPLRATARSVRLIVQDSDGRWGSFATFPLGKAVE